MCTSAVTYRSLQKCRGHPCTMLTFFVSKIQQQRQKSAFFVGVASSAISAGKSGSAPCAFTHHQWPLTFVISPLGWQTPKHEDTHLATGRPENPPVKVATSTMPLGLNVCAYVKASHRINRPSASVLFIWKTRRVKDDAVRRPEFVTASGINCAFCLLRIPMCNWLTHSPGWWWSREKLTRSFNYP